MCETYKFSKLTTNGGDLTKFPLLLILTKTTVYNKMYLVLWYHIMTCYHNEKKLGQYNIKIFIDFHILSTVFRFKLNNIIYLSMNLI